jgi:(p)ppGpp synthase/HD superfamily hydrolase
MSTDLIRQAWQFASVAHGTQSYSGPTEGFRFPYICHLAHVLFEVQGALPHHTHVNAELAMLCAILHDTIEDTPTTREQIADLFGEAVAQGVEALTKNEALPTKEEQMADSLARIRQQPHEIWMVKLADRIVNLSEPPFHWSEEKKIAYKKEGQQIYDALHEASPYLAKRLAGRIEVYPYRS